MGWAFFFLFVVLKVPVVAAFWLIWWAIRAEPELTDEAPSDGDGRGGRPRRRPPRPRPHRRGPHAAPAPGSPPRVRFARGRPLVRR